MSTAERLSRPTDNKPHPATRETWLKAYERARALHLEWIGQPAIGAPSYDLDRIHAAILQDYRAILAGKRPNVTPGYVSQLRGHLSEVGKIRKTLEAHQ